MKEEKKNKLQSLNSFPPQFVNLHGEKKSELRLKIIILKKVKIPNSVSEFQDKNQNLNSYFKTKEKYRIPISIPTSEHKPELRFQF